MKKKGQFTKESSRKAIEARDGIKLLCYYRPHKDKQIGTCVFRGNEYQVVGRNNKEVFIEMNKILIKNL